MTKHHDPLKEVEVLKRELLGLFQHIQRIRKEIASIRKPGAPEDEDHFLQMADELDAIVQATEQATDTIMENVEQMDDVINAVRPHITDTDALTALDTFPEKTGAIFEACAFQDITGQRITKVVNSLKFIEERVNALISMWGAEEIRESAGVKEETRDEYQKYLNGPQLAGHGVSQADVDAMFGGAVAKPASKPAAPAPAPPAKVAPAPASAPKPVAAPAPPPAAAKPAPVPKPAPAPAPKAPEEDEGPKLGQDDIDKLFG
ncbi:MAG: hypothetical protein WCZ23_10355 [Rhodospirillaceae bacterium]